MSAQSRAVRSQFSEEEWGDILKKAGIPGPSIQQDPPICSYCSAPNAMPTLDRWGHDSQEYRCADCMRIEHQPFDPNAPIDLTDRGAVLRWLIRNDRNGCHPDAEIAVECNAPPYTLAQAVLMYRYMRDEIDEDTLTKEWG